MTARRNGCSHDSQTERWFKAGNLLRISMRYSIQFALTLLICCSLTNAATYYVSPNGDDTADVAPRGPSLADLHQSERLRIHRPLATPSFSNAAVNGAIISRPAPAAKAANRSPTTPTDEAPSRQSLAVTCWTTQSSPPSVKTNMPTRLPRRPIPLLHQVFIPSVWAAGKPTITSSTDPTQRRQGITACLRGNVLFSNRRNHLVFKNLIVDETAGQLTDGVVQGYGIRIEGSTDVLLELPGPPLRHILAVINSTGFVGRHLIVVWARAPNARRQYRLRFVC